MLCGAGNGHQSGSSSHPGAFQCLACMVCVNRSTFFVFGKQKQLLLFLHIPILFAIITSRTHSSDVSESSIYLWKSDVKGFLNPSNSMELWWISMCNSSYVEVLALSDWKCDLIKNMSVGYLISSNEFVLERCVSFLIYDWCPQEKIDI